MKAQGCEAVSKLSLAQAYQIASALRRAARADETRRLQGSFHTDSFPGPQRWPFLGESEKPELDTGRDSIEKPYRPKDAGTSGVENMQLRSEPQEAVRAQKPPDVNLKHTLGETEQRYPKSAPGSLGKGGREDEHSVQGEDGNESWLLRLLPMSAERREEFRILHDKIFSRLEYMVQCVLFAIPLGVYAIRYLWPKLPAGCKRIEWQCSNGVLLYSDYHITSPESALALKSLEPRLRTNTLSSSSYTSYTSPSTPVRCDEARRSSSSRTTMSSIDVTDSLTSTTHSPDVSSSVRQNNDSSRANVQILFELCVNTEPRRTVLEELIIKTRGGTKHIDDNFALLRKFSLWDASCPFD